MMNDLTQALGHEFKADEVEITSFEPVPAGEYAAIITGAEIKDTKSGKGLFFEYTIQGTSHDGRVIKECVNIVNASEKAQKIGLETLAKISMAVGINSAKDTSEFINKRLKIKLSVEAGVGTYINKYGEEKPRTAQNSVKGYYPINSQPVSAQTPAEQTPASPVTQESGTRPWA